MQPRPRRHGRRRSGRPGGGFGAARHLEAMAPAHRCCPSWSAYIVVVALSAPLGYRPLSLAVLCVIGVIFATLRVDGQRPRTLAAAARRAATARADRPRRPASRSPISSRHRSPPGPIRDEDEPAERDGRAARPDRGDHRAARARPADRSPRGHTRPTRGATGTLPARWRTAALDAVRRSPLEPGAHTPSDRDHTRARHRSDRRRRHHVPRRRSAVSCHCPEAP